MIESNVRVVCDDDRQELCGIVIADLRLLTIRGRAGDLRLSCCPKARWYFPIWNWFAASFGLTLRLTAESLDVVDCSVIKLYVGFPIETTYILRLNSPHVSSQHILRLWYGSDSRRN